MIFGLLVAFFVQWIVTIGLSELGSAFPVSPKLLRPERLDLRGSSPVAVSTTSAASSAQRRTNASLLLLSGGFQCWLGGLSRKY